MTEIRDAFETLRTDDLLRAIDTAQPHGEELALANLIYGEAGGQRTAFVHHKTRNGGIVERGVTVGGESFIDVYEDDSIGPNAGEVAAPGVDLPELRRRLREVVFPDAAAAIVDEVHLLTAGGWIAGETDRAVWLSAFRSRSGEVLAACIDASDGEVIFQSGPVPAPIALATEAAIRRAGGALRTRVELKMLMVAAILTFGIFSGGLAVVIPALGVLCYIIVELLLFATGALKTQLALDVRRLQLRQADSKKALDGGDEQRAKREAKACLEDLAEVQEKIKRHGIVDFDFNERLRELERRLLEIVDD